MKRVYRWEHAENNLGPYSNMGYEDVHGEEETDRRRHPLPNLKKPMVQRRFAFSTPKQMGAWFNPEEQGVLHETGHAPNVYEVHPERVEYHKSHVSFDKEFAKKLPTPRIVKEE